MALRQATGVLLQRLNAVPLEPSIFGTSVQATSQLLG